MERMVSENEISGNHCRFSLNCIYRVTEDRLINEDNILSVHNLKKELTRNDKEDNMKTQILKYSKLKVNRKEDKYIDLNADVCSCYL